MAVHAALQVQLVRIHLRVPEYGWTTQKVFHLLNFLVCSLRVGIFAFRPQVESMHALFVKLALLDLPGASWCSGRHSSCLASAGACCCMRGPAVLMYRP